MADQVTQAATHLTSVVNVTTNNVTVYNGAAQLVGVHVQSTLSAEAVPIKDGGSGGTTLFTVPASAEAGRWYEAGNMRFDTDIYVDPDDAASTGTITVVYTPNNDGQAGPGA